VVVVAIIVAVVVAGGSNSKKLAVSTPPAPTAASATAAPADTAPASTSPPSTAPATTAAPTTTLLSQAAFASKADAICLAFRPQIQEATAAENYPALAEVAQQELDQIRALGDPAQGADLIHTMLNQGAQAVNWLLQNDPSDANVNIVAGDTAAGQFGMQVCNYGH